METHTYKRLVLAEKVFIESFCYTVDVVLNRKAIYGSSMKADSKTSYHNMVKEEPYLHKNSSP